MIKNLNIFIFFFIIQLTFESFFFKRTRKTAKEKNLANVSTSHIFLTSNANNGREGFLTIGNGFSQINACNENLNSGNNLLGKTSTTEEIAIYIDLEQSYKLTKAVIYQGSTNDNYYDSYAKKYKIYYSTNQVTSSNKGKNMNWELAGECEKGKIYSGAKVKQATQDKSDSGDSIDFSDKNIMEARSVKIVFEKSSCMGTGTGGKGEGTLGTVSIISIRIYAEIGGNEGDKLGEEEKGEELNVLFIGNSLTYYNKMWNVVKGLAEYNGHKMKVTSATNGGKDLIYQSTAENILKAIKKGPYDVVILQDKVGNDFQMDTLLLGSEKIIPIIRQYSPDCELIYYEPWPTKDKILAKMAYFTSSYITAAKRNKAKLAPAGEGFFDLYFNYELDFYCSDGRHPQPLGSFNSAATIYYALFPEDKKREYNGSEDKKYLIELINSNVAHTDEGKLDEYNIDILNLIISLGYKYAHEVIPAISGSETYISIADRKEEDDKKTEEISNVLSIGNSTLKMY